MIKAVSVYDVLISCPGDVAPFVDLIENAIGKFNNFYGRENNIILRPISWKNNAFPQFGANPQKILNKQIVDTSDFIVAVFWTRFGTKTEDYGSGTEEEIERMISSGKQVFLYFLDKPAKPSSIDLIQYEKIREFREKNKEKGLFFILENEASLQNAFREHLELYIDSIIHGKAFNSVKGSKMILWVDDCPENNVYIRSILENYGLKFDLALNTERAMRFLSDNSYSLVISDMGRKEGSREGYTLLKQIRDSGNNIPFIIFSSDGSRPEHRAEAEKNGAQGSTDIVQEAVNMVLKLIINS